MYQEKYERLKGPQVITRTIRPPRVAYIIGNLDQCDAFVQMCSLNWGGKHFCPVPYVPGVGLSEEWWRLLQAYDPDRIVSGVELDEETEERLIDMIYPQDLKRERKDTVRIPMRDPLPNGDGVYGQSLYSALVGAGAYEKREQFFPALVPDIATGHSLHLYMASRYGLLNERWSRSILTKGNLKYDLTLESLIPLERVGLGDNYLDFLTHFGRMIHDRGLRSLIDYTLTGLTEQGQGRSFFDDSPVYHDVQYLLIVSDGPTLEDFCWFWNLRAQRYLPFSTLLPVWLPRRIVEQRQGDVARLFHSRERGFVLSKTIPIKELQSLAQGLGSQLVATTEDLDRFYSKQFFLGIREEQEVFFTEGKLRTLTPRADVIQYCTRPHQYYFVDIELSSYPLPRLNVSSWGSWRTNIVSAPYRVSRTGLSFESGWEHTKYIAFAIPKPWQLLETFADMAGYSVELSDKGRLAQRLIQLVGDIRRFWLLSGRTVYILLDQLAEFRQSKEFKARLRSFTNAMLPDSCETSLSDFEQRFMQAIASDHHERALQQFSQIKDTLQFKTEVAEDFINWLIQRRIVFRGVELTCPVCRTKQWLSIDNIRSEMQCIGCQQTVEIPLRIEN